MSAYPKHLPSALGADDDGEPAYRRWTREEVQALIPTSIAPWRVVLLQLLAGLIVAGVVWMLSRSEAACVSSMWGMAAVVVPNALMARGISRRGAGGPTSRVVSFMFWELVKISFSVAMLVMATMVVRPLSWPALLVALVVCSKVYWLALLWRGRKRTS
jgi:ATP synthase protein I